MIEASMSEKQVQQEEEFSFKHYFIPLTTSKIIHFIIIIGIIVFANSLFNPFIFDDIPQIVQNNNVQQLSSIPPLFGQSLAFPGAHPGDLLHIYFKPLLFSSYTFLYSFFGANVFPFHVLQLLIHMCNAIFIYLLFKKFINTKLSFLLSIIFLIHPLNSETVIYIANLQDVLFTFFGLIALLTITSKKEKISSTRFIILFFSLLFSILSKETGIVFFLIVGLYVLFFQKKNLLFIFTSEIIALVIALLLRYNASFHATPIMSMSLIQHEPLVTRLLSIPKMIFYYLSHFVWPINLATGQEWIVKEITMKDFYLPLLIDTVFFVAILTLGMTIYHKTRKAFLSYLFFTLWFMLGLGMHLQLIPLDVTVADRWFYFPMIGVLGLLGLSIEKYKFSNLHLWTSILIICFLATVTIVRNAQWQSPLSLYRHDIIYAEQSPVIASYYGALLIDQKDYEGAKKYLTQSVAINPSIGSNLINLAVLYEHQGKYDKAERLYLQNINQNNMSPYSLIAYQSLARLALIKQHDPKKTKLIVKKGLQKYPSDVLLNEYLAVSLHFTGEKEEAKKLINKLHSKSPDTQTEKIKTLIQKDTLTIEKLLE